MKVLILMTRLSDYMYNCFLEWSTRSRVKIHAVHYLNDDHQAPFNFSEMNDIISFYRREDFNAQKLCDFVQNLRPNLIICFGWSDLSYLRAVKSRGPGTIAVITMDNQWLGTIRQIGGLVYSRLFLVRLFNYIWVPGERQRHFARLLGFSKRQIFDGYYVANPVNFDRIRNTISQAPLRRLVFVGRYVESKGLRELWRGFMLYHEENISSLELLCIGTGPLYAERPVHSKIHHLGFVQPKDLAEILQGGGIFILPSLFEPWGVVVHEFAIAGFPLILSTAVGAADKFLDSRNGILLTTVTPRAICDLLGKIDRLSSEKLAEMSVASAINGKSLDINYWCSQANAFLDCSD